MVGRCISCWKCLFSGAMLVSGRVPSSWQIFGISNSLDCWSGVKCLPQNWRCFVPKWQSRVADTLLRCPVNETRKKQATSNLWPFSGCQKHMIQYIDRKSRLCTYRNWTKGLSNWSYLHVKFKKKTNTIAINYINTTVFSRFFSGCHPCFCIPSYWN